jgi:hypothetical protein
MKIKSFHLAAIILITIFGSIVISSVLGLWQTTNDKIPETYAEGSYAGMSNPADIRGSYTFQNIQDSFGVHVEDLGIAFGLKDSASYSSFQVKQLESIYGSLTAQGKEVGTGSVRYFVALYKGLPYSPTETIYLPEPAVDILKAKANLNSEQVQLLAKYSVRVPNI